MFDIPEGKEFVMDGCNHLTKEEEAIALSKTPPPKEFDPQKVENRDLDVQYGPLAEQLFDVYRPATGSGPFPTVFYAHGGGWIMGSKRLCPLDGIIGLLDRGYAVVSVDYRLAPGAPFPEFIFDYKTALRFGRAHAKELGLDPAQFVSAGDSAGGHIALTSAFTAGRPEYAGYKYGGEEYSDAVLAVCDMYGPAILWDPQVRFFRESGVPRAMYDIKGEPTFFDIAFGTVSKELLDLVSPVNLVHKDIPAVQILHGGRDGVVPVQHSLLLYEQIEKVCGKGRAELVIYEDRYHADCAFETDENAAVMAGFFDRVLNRG